jgi:hypothetical protein
MLFHFVGDAHLGMGLGDEGWVQQAWEDEETAQREIGGRR